MVKIINIDYQLLCKLYIDDKLSTYAIASRLNLSQSCVMNNIVRYGIETRNKSESNRCSPRERYVNHAKKLRMAWKNGRYSKRIIPKRKWKDGGKLVICEFCGEVYSRKRDDPGKYCSWKCFIAARDYIGENNPNWRGGISLEPYSANFDSEFKGYIKYRDGRRCFICHALSSSKHRLVIHHIDYDKSNTVKENCVALCRSCHSKTNFDREYWIQFFRKEFGRLYGYNL